MGFKDDMKDDMVCTEVYGKDTKCFPRKSVVVPDGYLWIVAWSNTDLLCLQQDGDINII